MFTLGANIDFILAFMTTITDILLKKYYKSLGRKVNDFRERKGLSLNDLAAICDLEKTSISRIENGRTNITAKTALILAIALEIEPKELFDIDLKEIKKEIGK